LDRLFIFGYITVNDLSSM